MSDKRILSVPFEVICIDDKNRPVEIPSSKWPVKGQKYTVIGVAPSPMNGVLGFQLEELVLGDDCFPYGCFNTKRFGLPVQEKKDAIEEELADLGIEVQELEEV